MTDTRLDTANWSFDGFGNEFDEHVAAHLPGYADVQRLIALIASFTIPDGGTLADLGASTGRTAHQILESLPGRVITAHLYDADESMLLRALERVPEAICHVQDLTAAPMQHQDADLTVALWLLQFLSPNQRMPLLKEARAHASDDGVIIVAGKTFHTDSRWEAIAQAALDDYKAEAGVDAEARAAKTRSLRGVQHTQTSREISAELVLAGWRSPTVLWRWHIWTVIGAFARESL